VVQLRYDPALGALMDTHGSDALFPSADIPILTGLAKGAILPMCQQIETVL
jgi:hypothetical protein